MTYLVLEDGAVFTGKPFGARCTRAGEVVFNTGMVGYTEAITDPSYKGQILCQTYPLIGNYGICDDDFESDSPKIEAYIVQELCKTPVHHTLQKDLDSFLMDYDVPGIYGIDTRDLTKKLRTKGVMLGIISEDLEEAKCQAKNIPDPNERDLVAEVTTKHPMEYGSGTTIVVIDCGVKMNIIRSLVSRNVRVIRVPASYNVDKIMSLDPKGVLISNGPGDPKKVDYVIETARHLMEYKLPIFGLCLGHQILALALGGNTYKLKFGHRGQNHPCVDLQTKRCFMTSQNHGFAVDPTSLPEDAEVTMLNINDKTVEGIKHKILPVLGTQFHPEAAPGPTETNFMFDKFLAMTGDFK